MRIKLVMRSERFLSRTAVGLVAAVVAAATPSAARAQPEGPASTRVHIVNTRPDDDVGVLKLARYHGTTAQAAGSGVLVTTRYEPLCAEPCGVSVDVSERPIFFLVRDGNPVSHGFRLPPGDDVTVKLKPTRRGLWTAGFILTAFLILPAGIPMLVTGKSRLWIADGPPSAEQEFSKLKKAKL